MSGFTKAQLRFTRVGVDYARQAVDKVNGAISFATGPLVTFIRNATYDAPWIFFVGTTVVFMVCPLIVYPWVKKWLLKDPREVREAERVRLCLQKGIDPFPTVQHKDYVYGNVVPALQSDAKHAPKESSWEHRAIQRYREEKEKLLKEVGAAGRDIEQDVQTLLKLREELKVAHKDMKNSFDFEPEGLTFGRREVNKLNS